MNMNKTEELLPQMKTIYNLNFHCLHVNTIS